MILEISSERLFMRMIDLWAHKSFTTATTNKQFGRQEIGLNGVDVFYPAKDFSD